MRLCLFFIFCMNWTIHMLYIWILVVSWFQFMHTHKQNIMSFRISKSWTKKEKMNEKKIRKNTRALLLFAQYYSLNFFPFIECITQLQWTDIKDTENHILVYWIVRCSHSIHFINDFSCCPNRLNPILSDFCSTHFIASSGWKFLISFFSLSLFSIWYFSLMFLFIYQFQFYPC